MTHVEINASASFSLLLNVVLKFQKCCALCDLFPTYFVPTLDTIVSRKTYNTVYCHVAEFLFFTLSPRQSVRITVSYPTEAFLHCALVYCGAVLY